MNFAQAIARSAVLEAIALYICNSLVRCDGAGVFYNTGSSIPCHCSVASFRSNGTGMYVKPKMPTVIELAPSS
ncbi:hypothetical protein [Nostoc sp. PA-18-2419]|uniref:hypothetical protein n=1 Tax=Nostoc sp. PA-18-2419 TaxID=2575443 RepID=UPI00110889C4|nr:hypothetical protein [Nostoc sp. PA-18-2419]